MTVHHGDCRAILATFADASIDAIVTDPPYELGFMGKHWDASGIAYDPVLWSECLRVLKPGGHLLAFGGTRTYHRMAVAIEDAGFEIRDSIHWLYGSGFPKSLDVSKAIDKAAGVEFSSEHASGVGFMTPNGDGGYNVTKNKLTRAGDMTEDARTWEGWGTALKPAHEPIVVARKPLIGTVAANVLQYGTGAINVDGGRVGASGGARRGPDDIGHDAGTNDVFGKGLGLANSAPRVDGLGRWPANIVFTHAADCGDQCAEGCPVAALDEQSGVSKCRPAAATLDGIGSGSGRVSSNVPFVGGIATTGYTDTGGASRFFTVTEWDVPFRYIAKPSKRERNAGLDGLEERNVGALNMRTDAHSERTGQMTAAAANHHPTVKPLALMRWLVRLVTPPGGIVLDPFLGSGTTAAAAVLEGFDWVGCEMTAEYLPIIEGRVAWAHEQAGTTAGEATDDTTDEVEQMRMFG